MNYRCKRYAEAKEIDQNVNSQFCSGCNCTGIFFCLKNLFSDNCMDPQKCACLQLTITTNEQLSTSLQSGKKTYENRTLSEKVISGIYECNETCSCLKQSCFNRVVQQKIKIPLEVSF